MSQGLFVKSALLNTVQSMETIFSGFIFSIENQHDSAPSSWLGETNTLSLPSRSLLLRGLEESFGEWVWGRCLITEFWAENVWVGWFTLSSRQRQHSILKC